jgi:tRNA pseudouridine synthase 9
VTTAYVIAQGDEIEHYALRTEPPILDIPIAIVHEDEGYLVVDKPPSMIVHTGGGYHFNTLMGVLYYEHGKRGLYTLHRLDRLTSGLLLFSKSKQLA